MQTRMSNLYRMDWLIGSGQNCEANAEAGDILLKKSRKVQWLKLCESGPKNNAYNKL